MAAHAILIALLVLAPAGSPTPPEADRKPHELRAAVHEAMRQQATAAGSEKQAATRQLISLYNELAASTILTDADKREQMAYVRNRLRRTSDAIARQLAKNDDQDAEVAQAAPKGRAQPATQAIFAQKPGKPAVPAAGAAPRAANFSAPRGAATLGSQGAGQSWNAMTAANAQELVDLIQNTIAPHTWDVNGGHGSIRFFAPANVLVVRQSGGIHDQIGEAIQALRK